MRKHQVRHITATAAARDFSKLLDEVEGGGEAIIIRHSRPVAVIGPARETLRTATECLEVSLPRPSAVADPEFADDLEEIIKTRNMPEPLDWE